VGDCRCLGLVALNVVRDEALQLITVTVDESPQSIILVDAERGHETII
jgi:hypothetical protein